MPIQPLLPVATGSSGPQVVKSSVNSTMVCQSDSLHEPVMQLNCLTWARM
jgi:hypothetical protein